MKNKFIRLFAFLCFAFTFVFMSCNQVIPEDNQKDISGLPNANVIITLQPEAARTISPVNGTSYKDVSTWTVTFKETSGNGYDDIVKELSNSEPTISVTIPVGSFDVILEGVTEKNTVKYYGKASFTVTGDETESISVPVTVSPKKTEGGKGSFTYTLTVQDYPSLAELTSVLIPYDTSKENITLTTTETDSANHVFTITGTNIPSGFYKFSVNLTADKITKDVFKSFDNLVEIIDDTVTSDTKTINYVYEGEKAYYVSSSDRATGNGVFESMPININTLLERNDTVATVIMNFVDISDTTYPQIDVSKLQNKTYVIRKIYNTDLYKISKNLETGINITSVTENDSIDSYYTISLIDSTKTTADSNTVVNITNGRSIKLSLGGGVTVKTSEVAEIDIIENEYNESYSITNQPLLIVPSSAKVTLNSNKPTEGFELLGKTDNEGNMNYYFVKVGSAGISIIEGTVPVPDFSIVDATDSILSSEKTYYIGDTVTLKAKPDGDFIYDEGTTFMWYVNGKEQDSSTTDTFKLTFGKGDTAENNKIMCIACASGEYKSFVSEIIPIDRVALLYDTCSTNNTGVSFARISDLHTTTTSAGDIQKGDYITVIDCFIDSDQKVYTLYKNNGSNCYSESIFNGTGYDSPVEYSFESPYTPLQIKKGLDGNIYLLFKNTTDSTYEIKRVEADSSRNITFNNTSVEAFEGSGTTFFVDESSNVYYIKETTEIVAEGEIQTTKKSVKLMKNSSGTEVQVGAEIMSFTLGQPGGSIAGTNPSNLFIHKDPEFTDMRIIDHKLYLLIRHLNSETGYSYSTGCIIIIDMTKNETSVVGWDNNTYIKDTDSYTHDSNTFYGPDKIVAIKPKKIVIADDGVEHGSGYNAKQKQRFVVFDLETNTITDLIETPEGINFSDGTTGSFFY